MRYETIGGAVAATLLVSGCAVPAVRSYAPLARTEPAPVVGGSVDANEQGRSNARVVGAEGLRLLQEDPRIEASLTRIFGKSQRTLHASLHNGRPYLDMIETELLRVGVPPEFAFLPAIESRFLPHAVGGSTVGLWQFTGDTARRWGLIVDRRRDERKDPVKSSTAAARYLRHLYDMFGKWDLALAAYNAGPGRVQKALDRAPRASFWELAERNLLPAITREYVPKALASLLFHKRANLREART